MAFRPVAHVEGQRLGVSENRGYLILGVLIIRILLFRTILGSAIVGNPHIASGSVLSVPS